MFYLFLVFLGFTFLYYYFPIGLWFEGLSSGVSVGIMDLIGMRLKGVDPYEIVHAYIKARKAGLDMPELTLKGLEGHYLAGGDVVSLCHALIEAEKANLGLSFEKACAIDLAGRNVLEAVQISVTPKVIQTPNVVAMAKDGIQVRVVCRITVKANIERLIGGAGEDTIIARVGEGTVTTIGSAESHKDVLKNPNMISQAVRAKGLDSGTAFDILSIDIMDVDVGRNIGAYLRIDQAEADTRIAQANAEKRRSEAAARAEEMKAVVVEQQAKVVESEARVPLGLAAAIRQGRVSTKSSS